MPLVAAAPATDSLSVLVAAGWDVRVAATGGQVTVTLSRPVTVTGTDVTQALDAARGAAGL